MPLAPIAVFAYKRPDHLARTLRSLEACPEFMESELHIYCDGPRDHSEHEAVAAARAVAAAYSSRAKIRHADVNRGLAASITAGVADLASIYGRVIVVEDDLVVAPNFLTYLNQALDTYADDDRVMHITAYMYPVPPKPGRTDVYFLQTIGSWGWATWHRAWKHFDPDPRDWRRIQSEPDTRQAFNLGGAADFASMLRAQMEGRIDSWVIRWYWTVFNRGGLVCYPPTTLVLNKGFDRSGTHGARYTARVLGLSELPRSGPITFPRDVKLSVDVLPDVKAVLRSIFGGPLRRLLRNVLSHWRHLASKAGAR